MRGLVGFFIAIILSISVGFYEKSITLIFNNIKKGIESNYLILFFALWYAFGVFINILFRGGGLDSWRLMMGPFVFLIALFYLFAFMYNNQCHRRFQIAFILLWGMQAIFTFKAIYSDTSIVRQMVTAGAWIYGDQGGFAMIAMILPILIWRSLREHGTKKLVLSFFCFVMFITISITSFATPLGMIFLSIPLILLLLIIFPVSRRGHVGAIIFSLIIGSTTLFAYTFTHDNPLLAPAYYRLGNLIEDPTSGGYSGSDRETSRWALAVISLRSFEEEPFFGMGGGSIRTSGFVGGHSSALDSLGAYGLLGGGGAFCGMILSIITASFTRFRRERSWETLLGVVSGILLLVGGITNPYWEGIQPFCVLLMIRPLSKRKSNQ
jgi:hypothetical protein